MMHGQRNIKSKLLALSKALGQ